MNKKALVGLVALGGILFLLSRAKAAKAEISREEGIPEVPVPEERPELALLSTEELILKTQIERALSPYEADFQYASRQTGLDNVELLKGLVFRESSGNEKAVRYEPKIDDYSIGLGQILLSTAWDMGFKGTKDELFDPHTNLLLTAKYLKYHLDLNNGQIPVAVSAYNGGFKASSYYNQTGEFINPDHVTAVLKYYRLVKI